MRERKREEIQISFNYAKIRVSVGGTDVLGE